MHRVDFVACETHFVDHLAPMWKALPPESRGLFYVHPSLYKKCEAIHVPYSPLPVPGLHSGSLGPVVAASYADLVKNAYPTGRPPVLSEHGAGQTYKGAQSRSYAGAEGRGRLALAIVPGIHPYTQQMKRYPHIPCVHVGCSKLDAWFERYGKGMLPGEPTVAVSFHFECSACAETQSSWKYYLPVLKNLKKSFRLIGHAHPRLASTIYPKYKELGIEFVPNFSEVIARASLYCIDNSSTLFEFAAMDRPVVVLNQPAYRRHVEHGMRFWEYADIGLQVDRPADLAKTVWDALDSDHKQAPRRREIISKVYTYTDGSSAKRAAAAILDIKSVDQETLVTPDPEYKMRAIVTLRLPEGHVVRGDVFWPGWKHRTEIDSAGYKVRVPHERLLEYTPEQRFEQLKVMEAAIPWPQQQ